MQVKPEKKPKEETKKDDGVKYVTAEEYIKFEK
jgi:hypothetical protein